MDEALVRATGSSESRTVAGGSAASGLRTPSQRLGAATAGGKNTDMESLHSKTGRQGKSSWAWRVGVDHSFESGIASAV